ncbi:hypothetical protein, partial [Escherichia coli]|uniref:hypothetical protein n=1 Tax=Escherichia coli TaxID=562 RepID=UPI001BC8C0C6
RVFLVILFTSFSGSLVSRISGAVHTRQKATIRFTICDTDRLPAYCNFSTATGGHLSTKNLHSGGK